MITMTGNVPMTLEKANYYNALEKRDKAAPPEVVKGIAPLSGEEYELLKCPTCGRYVGDKDEFCRKCGQRIDQENEAL